MTQDSLGISRCTRSYGRWNFQSWDHSPQVPNPQECQITRCHIEGILPYWVIQSPLKYGWFQVFVTGNLITWKINYKECNYNLYVFSSKTLNWLTKWPAHWKCYCTIDKEQLQAICDLQNLFSCDMTLHHSGSISLCHYVSHKNRLLKYITADTSNSWSANLLHGKKMQSPPYECHLLVNAMRCCKDPLWMYKNTTTPMTNETKLGVKQLQWHLSHKQIQVLHIL